MCVEAAYISHMCTDKFGRYERSQKNVAQMSVFVPFVYTTIMTCVGTAHTPSATWRMID